MSGEKTKLNSSKERTHAISFTVMIVLALVLFLSVETPNQYNIAGLAGRITDSDFENMGFVTSNTTTLSINDYTTNTLTGTINQIITIQDDAIYHKGKYSINGETWQEITFTGTPLTNNWISGTATASIQLNLADFNFENNEANDNYIIIYSCTQAENNWNCHDNKWQIKQFIITYEETPSSQDMVAEYDLNTGSGTTVVDSVNDNDGTILNGASWNAGIEGSALSFDGVDDYVSFGVSPLSNLFSSDASISMWVNPVNKTHKSLVSSFNNSLGYSSGYNFRIMDDDINMIVGYSDDSNSYQWNDVVNFNEWQHLAFVNDASSNRVKLYVDGVDKGWSDVGVGFYIDSSDNELSIGSWWGNNVYWSYSGLMDDIKFFDYVLSADEVSTLATEFEISNPICGDNLCNGDETCSTCSQDCGVCSSCGDETCDDGESCSTCSQDCGVCVGGNLIIGDDYDLFLDYTEQEFESIIPDWRLEGESVAVLNMPFDDSNNPLQDYSIHNNLATLQGSPLPSLVNTQIGKGYLFDGSSIEVADDDSLDFGTEDFSIETWVKLNDYAPSGSSYIIAKGSLSGATGYSIGVTKVGFPKIGIGADGGSSQGLACTQSKLFTDDVWYHFVSVFDRDDKMKLYLNGELVCEIDYAAGNTGSVSNSQDLTIGAYSGTSAGFDGIIDDVKIFDRAVTKEYITQSYEDGLESHSLQTMPFEETNVGESWQVAITDNGQTSISNPVTVINPPSDECNIHVECNDGDADTYDICLDSRPRICSNPSISHECTTNSNCNDGNSGTQDICKLGLIRTCENIQIESGGDCSGYYIANNGDDSNSGTSPSSPWETINKANDISLQVGEQFCFKRGDTFYGELVLKQHVDGTPENPIGVGAYGTGIKPEIIGLKEYTGTWVDEGNYLWSTTSSELPEHLNFVVIDNVEGHMARYPKEGWLPVAEDSSNHYYLIGYDMGIFPDHYWEGGEVVSKGVHFQINRARITSHVGNRLDTGFLNYRPQVGEAYGYFLQNHPNILSNENEWAYLSDTKTLYLISVDNPNNKIIEVSTGEELVKIEDIDNVEVKDIKFSYSNENSVRTLDDNNVWIKNNYFTKSGLNGIFSERVNGINVHNNTITNSLSNGMRINAGKDIIIEDNSVTNIGNIPGRGHSHDEASNNNNKGILIGGGEDFPQNNNLLIRYNFVNNTGSGGIQFNRKDSLVDRNFVSHNCLIINDCGAIYTNSYALTNRTISNNIVVGSGSEEMGYYDNGIYLDGGTRWVTVENNTAFDIQGMVAHGNGNEYVTIKNNFYGFSNLNRRRGETGIVAYGDYTLGNQIYSAYNFSFHNNILFIKEDWELIYRFYEVYEPWIFVPSNHLLFDNNYFISPYDDDIVKIQGVVQNTSFTFEEWQAGGYDLNSKKAPFTLAQSGFSDVEDYYFFDYNAAKTAKTISLPSGYRYYDIDGNLVTGTQTIKPYGSIFLLRKTL